MALMARAYNQAQKFGVDMAIPDEAIALDAAGFKRDGRFALNLANGERAHARAVVIASGVLEAVCWRGPAGEETRHPLRHLFLFIGADPNTDWLKDSGLALDPKGFVLTGSGTDGVARPLETSVRGVFAIGDVRSGSTKRVAAAVGEGAQVVAALHAFLAETEKQPAEILKAGSA